jgi:hypothetical protein
MDELRHIINECFLVGAGFEPARLHAASGVLPIGFQKQREELKVQRCSLVRLMATMFEKQSISQSFTRIKSKNISMSSSIAV